MWQLLKTQSWMLKDPGRSGNTNLGDQCIPTYPDNPWHRLKFLKATYEVSQTCRIRRSAKFVVLFLSFWCLRQPDNTVNQEKHAVSIRFQILQGLAVICRNHEMMSKFYTIVTSITWTLLHHFMHHLEDEGSPLHSPSSCWHIARPFVVLFWCSRRSLLSLLAEENRANQKKSNKN